MQSDGERMRRMILQGGLLDWIFLSIGSRDLRRDVSRNNVVGCHFDLKLLD